MKSTREEEGDPMSALAVDDTTSSALPARTNDGVATRAYDLFCQRGCEHGHDMDDWLQAERELEPHS
jgi:hypothetical protein